jgi:hypothetical protein
MSSMSVRIRLLVATLSATYNQIPIQMTALPNQPANQPIIYRPNNRENKSLKIQNPNKKKRTPSTIRIIFVVPGDVARVMRSAEDTKPEATELNVLVYQVLCPG